MDYKNPRQLDYERIAKEGCYFLSLVRAGERLLGRYVDAYELYLRANANGKLASDCFVHDPAGILSMILGGRWAIDKQTPEYKSLPDEIVVLRYERREGMTTLAHFVLAGADGSSVEYDPYGDSKTVREGTLISKRVLWRVDKS